MKSESPSLLQDNPEMDAFILQAHNHHKEISGQLDTLIHQNERDNPEAAHSAMIQQNESLRQAVEDGHGKTAEAINSLKEAVISMSDAINHLVDALSKPKDTTEAQTQ